MHSTNPLLPSPTPKGDGGNQMFIGDLQLFH